MVTVLDSPDFLMKMCLAHPVESHIMVEKPDAPGNKITTIRAIWLRRWHWNGRSNGLVVRVGTWWCRVIRPRHGNPFENGSLWFSGWHRMTVSNERTLDKIAVPVADFRRLLEAAPLLRISGHQWPATGSPY
jgi:hypothetical protein